jgi:AraC-like DNA-binding protein
MPRQKLSRLRELDVSTLCERIFLEQLRRADEMTADLRVPSLRDHVMERPGLHFHFNPDLIIGLRGSSRFEFIHEHFVVGPGTLAIIPGGIPHREVPLPAREGIFENLVVSVYNETVSVQLQMGRKEKEGMRVESITEYYDTTKYQHLAHYLDEIAELSHSSEPDQRMGVKGLLLIYFSTLESVIRRVRHSPPVEKLKISQAKRLVQEHLGQADLGVRFLAGLLHCSSDYLSNLFHRETGQRLVTHINRERIRVAMTMLRTTPLTIAEVAYAVGFDSQGYFSRVFKQIALKSPIAYRRSIEHSVIELEGRPRTIYAALS